MKLFQEKYLFGFIGNYIVHDFSWLLGRKNGVMKIDEIKSQKQSSCDRSYSRDIDQLGLIIANIVDHQEFRV